MATERSELATVMRLLLQNIRTTNYVMDAIVDFALLIEHSLERCAHEDCMAPATVEHVDARVKLCDNHASRVIITAKLQLKDASIDQDMLVTVALASEERWHDVPNATNIRHLNAMTSALTGNDAPDPRSDLLQYH